MSKEIFPPGMSEEEQKEELKQRIGEDKPWHEKPVIWLMIIFWVVVIWFGYQAGKHQDPNAPVNCTQTGFGQEC